MCSLNMKYIEVFKMHSLILSILQSSAINVIFLSDKVAALYSHNITTFLNSPNGHLHSNFNSIIKFLL